MKATLRPELRSHLANVADATVDAYNGRYVVTHGSFLDREVVLRAAGIA